MADLKDGESVEVQGAAAKPYVVKNTGGVYSCTCPAWRNQSTAIEQRTCKHIRKLRGDAAENERLGGELPAHAVKEKEAAAGPPLLLAQAWDNSTDLADWWMSEKLDGVRAWWDGKQFVSRLGNTLWEISRDGLNVIVRFGRIGTNGQTQTKSFASEEAAKKHASKLIDEKTAKGYVSAQGE